MNRLRLLSCAATLALLGGRVLAQAEPAELAGAGIQSDPHPFRSVAELLRPASESAYDYRAVTLKMGISRALGSGEPPEGAAWTSLLELNPCRRSEPVQAAISEWSTRGPAGAKPSKGPAAAGLADEADADYSKGAFLAAALGYRELLVKHPEPLSARNNLALVQIHLGNDLAAQLELEIVRRAAPAHYPALVNLALLYERLGQREKSERTAQEATAARTRGSPAGFDGAWAAALALDAADKPSLPAHLSDLLASPAKPTPRDDGRQEPAANPGEKRSWLATGLARALEARLAGTSRTRKIWSALAWLIAGTAFLAASFMAVAISIGLGQRWTAAAAFFVIGAPGYLLCWGPPKGSWWAGLLVYLLIGALAAAEAAD